MYTKGEVIWAKIKGFPWWPGVVAKVIEDKENSHGIMEILVNFIGENSHAQLSLDKVAKYQEKYDEYAKMKKKKLLLSIEIANKILNGETTFQAEYEKLEEKDSFSQKKIPTNTSVTQRKRGDSKSDEKSPSTGGMQCESELTSPDDSEANHLILSPNDKESKKPKVLERKDSKKGAGLVVSRKASQVEKSPAISKNLKNRGNSKRESEDFRDEEPRIMKAFKLDGNTDENYPPKDDLTGRSDKTDKSPFIFNSLDAAFNQNNNAHIEGFNAKNSRKNSSALINSTHQSNEANKPMTSEFDGVREMIIDKIVSNGSPSVCGPILEKSIEDVISKINPETVSISEIIENDLGKNIYTLIILLDELLSSVPRLENESELSDLKEKLVSFNDTLKNRLALYYVENVDYCSVWLKKMEQKREQKATLKAIENSMTKSPRVTKAEKVEKTEKSEKLQKLTRQAGKEIENSMARSEGQAMEEEKSGGVLQINFENYKYESDKKKAVLSERDAKIVTTSTKVNKPIYTVALEASKMDSQQKAVTNPTLRKKICLKMSKILQEKYNLEKNLSQEMTLKIETKIRNLNPDMQMEYKNKVLIVLKLLKYSLIDIQDFVNDLSMDFYVLREKLEAYHKQHGETSLDANLEEDSPSLTKEISQSPALINMKINEFKRGENKESIAQIA